MEYLGWGWRSKGKIVGGRGNQGSNSIVGIPHKTIGNQSIGWLHKDLPDSMMARLVQHVKDRITGEVAIGWCGGQSQPPKGIAIISWMPKAS